MDSETDGPVGHGATEGQRWRPNSRQHRKLLFKNQGEKRISKESKAIWQLDSFPVVPRSHISESLPQLRA